MESLDLKNKLKEQFLQILNDETKLSILDGIFDSLTTTFSSLKVSEEHYSLIEERRKKFLAGETTLISWEEIKENIQKKYDF